MLKRLANKSMMYHAVKSMLDQNKTVWEPVPAMAATIQAFDSLLEEINLYRQLTQGSKKGITRGKANQQELVIGRTYELASMVYAMAIQTDNSVLAAKVGFTESGLLKKRDNQLVTTCKLVATLATEHLDGLLAYGVTAGEIESLEEEIKLFADNIPAPRISVAERKAANEKLRSLFAEVDALLKKQLDRLMVRYRKTNPDFYALYPIARRIINYGVRHEKEKNAENQDQKQ